MASLPSENPYSAQGTILFQCIPTEECRAQMLGKTAVELTQRGEVNGSGNAAALGVSFKGHSTSAVHHTGKAASIVGAGVGADGRPLVSAAAATAALNAQHQQQKRAALVAAASSSAARSGATSRSAARRSGTTSSILLPSASKAAASASRQPRRLAPLDGTGDETVSAGLNPTTDIMSADPQAGASSSAQALTAEKALARLFQPIPVSTKNQHSTSSGSGSEMTSARTHGAADDAADAAEPQWMQVASTAHTSRIDVLLLHQHLAERCEAEHARPEGSLCVTREAIFRDGYRELMRQVTVLCPERGLLMEELDQHMSLSTDAYDTLFDSACQYAARKSIERDLRSYLFDDKTKLESEVRRFENRVNELRAKHDGLLKRFEEQKASSEKLQEEELGYLKKANQQLVSEIKRLSTLESAMSAATKASTEGG